MFHTDLNGGERRDTRKIDGVGNQFHKYLSEQGQSPPARQVVQRLSMISLILASPGGDRRGRSSSPDPGRGRCESFLAGPYEKTPAGHRPAVSSV